MNFAPLSSRLSLLAVSLALLAVPAFAQLPGDAPPPAAADPANDPAVVKEAKDVLNKYLGLVKAKKWADAKKLIHPKTMAAIADRKKRTGSEDHAMAPWAKEKTEYYLKDFKIGNGHPAPLGTVVVEVTEDNFQVEEKGVAEGDVAAYLLGKQNGTWWVVDKVRGGGFPEDGIKLGYKGWFDKQPKPAEGDPEKK